MSTNGEGSTWWEVKVSETQLSVSVRVEALERDPSEHRRVVYRIAAASPEAAQNIVANRIHRAMLGFPQDPEKEGATS